MPIKVILYSTSHCHLCELAISMLSDMQVDISLEIIEITTNDALLNQYALKIPVLQREDSNTELNWPFNAADIHHFLK